MNTQKNQTEKMFCNCCGKEVAVEDGIVTEGVASFAADWGYFSRKDGEHHSFSLCETCYDKIVKTFAIPVTVQENNELI